MGTLPGSNLSEGSCFQIASNKSLDLLMKSNLHLTFLNFFSKISYLGQKRQNTHKIFRSIYSISHCRHALTSQIPIWKCSCACKHFIIRVLTLTTNCCSDPELYSAIYNNRWAKFFKVANGKCFVIITVKP